MDRDGKDLKVDWSMLYAHSSEAKLTKAKVYRNVVRRLAPDGVEAVTLGMTCAASGTVTVSGGGSDAMRGRATSLVRLP